MEMSPTLIWTAVFVFSSFALYIGIAVWARAATTDDFYVAGHHVHPVFNGMATAADWMSAASFLSMAGIIAFAGYDGSVYLMGWTGGYVLLALLLAPYLRKFGKFTVPDFVGDRYYSQAARIVAVICALFISFTYIAGQMRGVGIAFSNFLQVPVEIGVFVGAIVVLFYAVLGGMKGITYTQVAQYCVLIFAFMVPAIFLSLQMTGSPIPQLGFVGNASDGVPLLQTLDRTLVDLGFQPYTQGQKSTLDVFAITLALMVGTAGLPHVIIRFFTVPKASDARKSAGWALLFIAILYTTAPAVSVFARSNFIDTVNESEYSIDVARGEAQVSGENATPQWFYNWERTGLLGFTDLNDDGRIQYRADPDTNEVTTLDRDIFVLANPEIGRLPAWVIGLVVAGGLAAALSTAAGLLMVISSAVSHDLCRKVLFKSMSDTQELLVARLAAVAAVLVAIYAGINPPGFVAAVVAFAFGLAAASFFPAIFLGIFWKRMNKTGAIAGMLTGLTVTAAYIVHFKIGFSSGVLGVCALLVAMAAALIHFGTRGAAGKPGMIPIIIAGLGTIIGLAGLFGGLPGFAQGTNDQWLMGISPEGFGTIGMLISFVVSVAASLMTAPPPQSVQDMIEDIRMPST
jgi:cation/acetate symporter